MMTTTIIKIIIIIIITIIETIIIFYHFYSILLALQLRIERKSEVILILIAAICVTKVKTCPLFHRVLRVPNPI